MRNVVLPSLAMLAIVTVYLPSVVGVMHDDPCMAVGAGDAANGWAGARALSAAALGAAGCTTESIAVGNSCGAPPDLSDWFYVNVLQPSVTVSASLSANLFGFCGGTGLDVTLSIYFQRGGSALPDPMPTPLASALQSAMPTPGDLVCSVNMGGLAAGESCAPVTINPALGGRLYVHKGVVGGIAGANTLRVALT